MRGLWILTCADCGSRFVKSEQEQMLDELAAKCATTAVGRAVSRAPDVVDPFWQILPSLLSTKFPSASDEDLKRVAGMVEFSLGSRGLLEDDVIQDPWRPHEELHAYMPGLGKTSPFLDPDQLDLCKQLSENYETIAKEYEALLEERFDRKGNDKFQSITSSESIGMMSLVYLWSITSNLPSRSK